MPAEPLILSFDTSAAHCAAALLRGDTLLGARIEEMSRGQAERLMPILEELLADHGAGWADLDALGVGIGPGNFTGIRISVSAARGLALARKIPAIGVSNFEILREGQTPLRELVSVAAPRDQAYLQLFDQGAPAAKPVHFDPANPDTGLAVLGAQRVLGAHAEKIAALLGIAQAQPCEMAQIPERIARIAARKLATLPEHERPAPLYIRAADAAPPSDAPPKILD
ncbi:tRNA (adenosine(37)-N6)-threonylcarbamoyltransferase complex dimerization subunit type 1 TsaB [Thioclava litoralis]|uniref:tRNA (Adenosine(37)-N6)-threonylcarbamoyltransferase complex dimerization subunit type 1 TsaB n=1 Tax=Thioclava litoralis TaxID=3076557 RepID=A0ABZ1E1K0_9RHOB|nr:tRNA (adenosine(37)-N6)-threonylcarbamoyltransferase complex dimerization subunit type 1 TsaB [Thioclava sp. FTW29]